MLNEKLSKLLPGGDSPLSEDRGDYITFKPGGFAADAHGRPEFSARLYHELRSFRQLADAHEITAKKSLEIGCAYGRLSPWIAEYAEEAHAIEPNPEPLEAARHQYPDITFHNTTADELPYEDDSFDLVVTWTVLQHIPPQNLSASIKEIKRILAPAGSLIICEESKPELNDDEHTWPRSVKDYKSVFSPLELIDQCTRGLEPSYPTHAGDVMLFTVQN